MAAFDYAKTAATAERLLARFGSRGSIRVSGERSDWDDTAAAVTDHPCTLVVLPIKEEDTAGTLIDAGDVRVLVSVVGLPITPSTVNHVVTANGIFGIIQVKTLAPAGVAVLHDLVGRR